MKIWPLMLVVSLGCFAACSGQGDTDFSDLSSDRLPVGGDDDDDVDTTSVDSAIPDDGVFDIYYLQVDATFGWDNETRQIVNVSTVYGEIPPAITISLGDERWAKDDFSAESEGYCLIVLPLSDPTPLPNWVVFDSSLYFGFDYRGSDQPITDCGTPDYAYDESVWGDQLHRDWATLDWGVAIGSLRDEYYTNFVSSNLFPFLAGAQINNTLIYTSGNEGVLGYVAVASQIDAGHRLIVESDGRQPMVAAEDIERVDGGMATGLYRVLPLYIFTFGTSP